MRSAWLLTFSRDAMRILCLSLAGRWWRAECYTGELEIENCIIFFLTQPVQGVKQIRNLYAIIMYQNLIIGVMYAI